MEIPPISSVILDVRTRVRSGIFTIGIGWLREILASGLPVTLLAFLSDSRRLLDAVPTVLHEATVIWCPDDARARQYPNRDIPVQPGERDLYLTPGYFLPELPPRNSVMGLWDDLLLGGGDAYLQTGGVLIPHRTDSRQAILRSIDNALSVITGSRSSHRAILKSLPGLRDRLICVRPYPSSPPFAPRSSSPPNQRRSPSKAAYILTVSRAKPHKRLLPLIEAWNQVQRRGARLIVAGLPPSERSSIRRTLGPTGLLDSVALTPDLPLSELVRLYQHALAVVSYSIQEGFNLPLHEAARCNTPLIATAIPVNVEFHARHAHILDPDAPWSLITKMEEAIDGILATPSRLTDLARLPNGAEPILPAIYSVLS